MTTLLTRFGEYLLEKALAAESKQAGLITASVQLTSGRVEYLKESNSKDASDAIVMLHGAAADKTSWTRFARYLHSPKRLVIPDLPGHGNSVACIDLDYSIAAQAERLKELLSTLGIMRAHLIGNSMGGTLAVRLAATAPGLVSSLVLMAPAGFEASPSWLRQHFSHTGGNPMIELSDVSGYRAMLRIGMESPPYIPGIMLSALTRAFILRKSIHQKVIRDIEFDLDQTASLHKIVVPSLIIWGAADKVEHVNNAEFLHRRLGDSRKIILKGIGHVPMVEAPREVADACRTFYSSLNA